MVQHSFADYVIFFFLAVILLSCWAVGIAVRDFVAATWEFAELPLGQSDTRLVVDR